MRNWGGGTPRDAADRESGTLTPREARGREGPRQSVRLGRLAQFPQQQEELAGNLTKCGVRTWCHACGMEGA